MPDFGEMHVEAALGAALERAGYRADDAALREWLPTAARGHNLAVVAPPAAVYAMPAVAAALSAAAGEEIPGPRLLILCAESALDEWQASLGSLLRGTEVRVHVARGTARAARRLRQGELDLLVVTPDTALALMEQSALKTDALPALFLAWPETWEDVERITPLMQDLPHDAQRIIYTGNPDGSRELVERYARKALTLGLPGAGDPAEAPAVPAGAVRTVMVPWSLRAQAVAGAVEVLDPTGPVVWTAWPSADRAMLPLDAAIELVSGDAPEGDAVIACDLPDAGRLGQLIAAGPVVLLVPPHGREWVERIAPAAPRNALRLPDAASAAAAGAGQRRGEIREMIGAGGLEGAHLALAPLFDRYDAAAVAAALYRLWTEARGKAGAREAAPGGPARAAAVPGATVAPGSSTARIWVGVGRKDGATANDLVGTLTREVGVDRQKIGKVEIRELYTLVEVPAPEAENIARGLMGRTIRRRRVAARLDRGATRRE